MKDFTNLSDPKGGTPDYSFLVLLLILSCSDDIIFRLVRFTITCGLGFRTGECLFKQCSIRAKIVFWF